MNAPAPLTALALVCTLSSSPAESSSELFAHQLLGELAKHDVTGTTVLDALTGQQPFQLLAALTG